MRPGKKRLRSAVVANNTVPRNRAPVVSTGEPTMSDIVGGMASGHHFLRIQSYSSTVKGRPTGEYIRSHHFTVGGHHWCIDYFPNGTDKAYADHVSLRLILHQSINNPAVKSQRLRLPPGGAANKLSCSLEKVKAIPGKLVGCGQFIKGGHRGIRAPQERLVHHPVRHRRRPGFPRRVHHRLGLRAPCDWSASGNSSRPKGVAWC
ncbi:hypothetical protein ZWY2020_023284 [Hordeum vulgare]|nr:hypothetical protein ZWY2020_023284 [Hordeum vulgare]